MGNEPTIKAGGYLLASDFRSIQRGDFVVHHQRNPRFERAIWVQRVIGMAGDTVRIANGTAYVNGVDGDDLLVLNHAYQVPGATRSLLKESGVSLMSSWQLQRDTLLVMLTPRQALQFGAVPYTGALAMDSLTALEWSAPDWTSRELGPLVVPPGELFILGDNRDNSLDSRSIGTIREQDVIGVVFKIL